MMKLTSLLLSVFILSAISYSQVTVPLNPDKDNSIYSESANSNGLGELYSGQTCSGNSRRALIHFDVAGMIPAGSVITAVSLDLTVSNSGSGSSSEDYNLHPVITDWGEGTSSGTGTGAAAVAPDATWADAMFGTAAWTIPGGDYSPSVAMTTLPAGNATYTWSSAGMITNVQTWLDSPGSNFEWILIGDETATCTARRFGSKDAGTAPVLSITYTCGTPPTVSCQTANVYLDASGNGTLNPADLDNGSTSNCGGSLTFSASQTSFNCGDITSGSGASLVISAVYDGPLPGGLPKGVELYAINDIPDLSIYGIGSANNGGGTDGEEFTFPADVITAGTYIYIASEATEFTNWFGFAPDYTSSAANINGDDAIELFMSSSVIDVFGDINLDGTGQPWEYLDGWAYRNSTTGPDGTTFNLANWTFSGPNALDGETSNAAAVSPVPNGTFTTSPTVGFAVTLTATDDFSNTANCGTSVFIIDTIAPTVSCIGSTTLLLDITGSLSILTGDIDAGSSDACGIASMSLSKSDFTCADIGLNSVYLIVTDNNGNIDSCLTDITIDGSNVMSITNDGVTDVTCFGGTDGAILISTVGGAPTITFDWDNDGTGDFDDTEDLSGLSVGDYEVIASDANGCTSTMSFTITEPAQMDLTVNQASFTLGATLSGVSYQWLDCSDFSVIAGETGQNFTATASGSYAVELTDGSGCVDTTACITLSDVSIDEDLDQIILVYPNPSTGIVYLDLNAINESVQVEVLDIKGSIIYSNKKATNVELIDFSSNENGIYLIHIYTGSEVIIKRVTIAK